MCNNKKKVILFFVCDIRVFWCMWFYVYFPRFLGTRIRIPIRFMKRIRILPNETEQSGSGNTTLLRIIFNRVILL